MFDPNVLEVDENQIIIRLLDGEGPVIVVVYMVQQINCIKNKAGEIVEVSHRPVVYSSSSIERSRLVSVCDAVLLQAR